MSRLAPDTTVRKATRQKLWNVILSSATRPGPGNATGSQQGLPFYIWQTYYKFMKLIYVSVLCVLWVVTNTIIHSHARVFIVCVIRCSEKNIAKQLYLLYANDFLLFICDSGNKRLSMRKITRPLWYNYHNYCKHRNLFSVYQNIVICIIRCWEKNVKLEFNLLQLFICFRHVIMNSCVKARDGVL